MKSRLGIFKIQEPLRSQLRQNTLNAIESPESYGQVVRRYDSRWRTGNGAAKYIVEWRRGNRIYVTDIIRLPAGLEADDG